MRHAEVSYPGAAEAGRVALTPRGREQAAAAGRSLAGVRFDLVVTSTLARTVETAEVVLAEQGGGGFEQWPDLDEWRPGDVAAIPAEELETGIVRGLLASSQDHRFLGGETLAEIQDRVHTAIGRLLERDWSTALAVLHGGVNRVTLSYALSGGVRAYYGNIEQAPACINVLDLGAGEWTVRTVNYAPYDPLHPARTTTMEEHWLELHDWLQRS
jgi:probable phosphoglycerate mutase